MKGPQFLSYMKPLTETLKENGGSGTTSDIIDLVIDKLKIPDHKVDETIPSGQSRFPARTHGSASPSRTTSRQLGLLLSVVWTS